MEARPDRRVARRLIVVLAASVGLSACGDGLAPDDPGPPEPEFESRTSNLSTAQKRDRARVIARVAASEGLENPILLAGIAEAETNFAHCWSEATWACKGPHSSFCGGPVIAGGSDGACSRRQGGLGMFQFDAGTYDDTLQREGREVLSLEGNIRRAVAFVSDMVRDSDFIGGVSSRSEAMDWMNGVEVGGHRYRTWLKTVTAYYNGCFPNRCGIYHERFHHYDNAHKRIESSLGATFWEGLGSGGSSSSGSSSSSGNSGGSVGARPPETPGGVGPQAAEIGNGETIDLSWDAGSRVDRWDLQMETKRRGVWYDYHEWNPASPPFRVWPQRDDAEYRWRIRACNSVGCSSWSNWRRFAVGSASVSNSSGSSPSTGGSSSSTSGSSLTPPSGLAPDSTAVRSDRADLQWESVSGAATYVVNLRYWDDGAEQWRHYHTWSDVGTASKSVWPALDGRTYGWRVRACDGSSCSDWSSWAIFRFGP